MSLVHDHKEQPIPRGALWFVAVLVTFTMMSAGAVRLGYAPVASSPVAVRTAAKLTPTATRNLSFVDRADGGLTITDVGTGRIVKSIVPGEPSGFIRGMLRGMGRERRMNNVAKTVPYRLESWPNGQLSLTDTGTGRSIELTAFGPTNRTAMADLLK